MNRFHQYTLFFVIISIVFVATPATGGPFFDKFVDPEDKALDASQWILDSKGFMPVPIIITEPAVGVGGGAALLFFHEAKTEKEKTASDVEDEMLGLPPSISFGVGAYTENDSWILGGGHFGSWKEDSIRYTGIIGGASLNLNFHGSGDDSALDNNGLDFNIDGFFLLQEMKFRIKESNFFVGARYSFLGSDIEFEVSGMIPGVSRGELDSNTAGLGLLLDYDSRDNIMTTNHGHEAKFEFMRYDKALGGDFYYNKIKAVSHSYWGPLSDVVLGIRLDGRFTDGDTPFYDLPYIDLRGIPAMRYQDDHTLVGELEARWDVRYRWSLVGFLGSGWAAESLDDFSSASGRVAGGGGVRYLVARKLGMRAGFDIAQGPEDTVFYIRVGNSW